MPNPYHRGKGGEGGRFTTPALAGAQGAESEKARRARMAYQEHHVVSAEHQRYAEANEAELAREIKGASFEDNEPIDVVVPDETGRVAHGIEVKTMLDNTNAKITMRGDALARKRSWARRNKATLHTIVIDDSAVYGTNDQSQRAIYYRRGVGSFRVSSMLRVTGGYAQVRSLLGTPTRQLPEGGW